MDKAQPFLITGQIVYNDDAVVSKTIIDKGVGSITLFSFDAGQGLSEHTSPYDAVVNVVDGSAEITIGTTPCTVRSGEMIIMPARIPHQLHARERFKMVLTMIREAAPDR